MTAKSRSGDHDTGEMKESQGGVGVLNAQCLMTRTHGGERRRRGVTEMTRRVLETDIDPRKFPGTVGPPRANYDRGRLQAPGAVRERTETARKPDLNGINTARRDTRHLPTRSWRQRETRGLDHCIRFAIPTPLPSPARPLLIPIPSKLSSAPQTHPSTKAPLPKRAVASNPLTNRT